MINQEVKWSQSKYEREHSEKEDILLLKGNSKA